MEATKKGEAGALFLSTYIFYVCVCEKVCDHAHSLLQVLWPFLLEFLVPPAYTNAVGIVARCVADIAGEKRKNDDEDYDLNYDEQGV